jgi:hypothetical protein
MPRKRVNPIYKERWLGLSKPEYRALLRLKGDIEEEALEPLSNRDMHVAALLMALVARGLPIPTGALDDVPDGLVQAIRSMERCQPETEGPLS